MKSYTPTRLQMQALALKKAEREKAALQQRVAEMEEKMAENVELNSHNGSNSQQHVSPRSEHDAYVEEDQDSIHSDDGEEYLVDRCVVAPPTAGSPGSATPTVQHKQCNPVIATSPNNDDTPRFAHNGLLHHLLQIGKDVTLYALLRSEPVAKGTIISTNHNSVLGGEALGNQYCEVVVNVVLKRDTILPRPYGDVETMADACKMSIAWPYKRLKEASQSCQGTAGAPRNRRHFGPKTG